MLTQDTLENYKKSHEIEWANNLPEDCPPDIILVPDNQEMYRLTISADQVTEEDFKPYLELYPDKQYSGINKVLASGLSVLASCEPKTLNKLPIRKKLKGVAKLTLNPDDGVLAKSGGDNHYTWWRTKSFDINSAEIVKNEDA